MKESISEEEREGVLPVELDQQMFQDALFKILTVLRHLWKILKYRLKSGVCSFSLLEYTTMQIFPVHKLNCWTQDVSCVRAPEVIIALHVCWILNQDRLPDYFMNRPRMTASLSQILSELRPFQPRMWKQALGVRLCTCIILSSGSSNTHL